MTSIFETKISLVCTHTKTNSL